MKYIFILFFIFSSIYGSVLKSTITSVDNDKNTATMVIDKIDVGMSGFIVHKFDEEHASILKNAEVESYDSETKVATLKLSDYVNLENSALPKGKWNVQVGDSVILAYGYSRALLIAPDAEIYNKVTKNTNTIQWLHPDIFVAVLSMSGHPTPLKEDFDSMSDSTSVGLLFIFVDSKLYTLDAKSFKILNISDIPIKQKDTKLPFYSRIDEIEAAFFGEGSTELKEYSPHYYSLLVKYNSKNKELFDIVKSQGEKYKDLLKEFEIEEQK